ncbi:hypothetical protein [Fusibacter sp. 3D3]|uniref:hypothetical protein n=1 Tax=Fusibacter sp. 3D3 TaxID=1048380 RepID=UPI000852C63E|nr:hypothetical protein [Fusibacter sp. 3D3]GAU78503.1 hypothetical protein F3D3_3137 [Fusibacter sp. 3D3]
MTKRPTLISFIAYISIIAGIASFLGIFFMGFSTQEPISNKLLLLDLIYSILFMSTGYYLLKDRILGWQLGLFNQLLSVTKCYGALVYIFINISRIDFDTNHIGEYLFRYAINALISMGLVYYFLNLKTLNFFKIDGKIKILTLQYAILLSFVFISIQIVTHTISL